MGTSLSRYLKIKVHQSVLERPYNQITIMGVYNRKPPSVIFGSEKKDKPFNWKRPTARLDAADPDHLLIECFPGYDHVEHYAEIIATKLGILQRGSDTERKPLTDPRNVGFISSSCSDTQAALQASNLAAFPQGIDTVVLGLVHRLDKLTGPPEWTHPDATGCFAWTVRNFGSRRTAFIGFRPSFWGDISGEIVHYLAARCGVREVLYFGKLGSVKQGVRPNKRLATGGRSLVRGQGVEWENVLAAATANAEKGLVAVGDHVTLGSVLHETKDWLAALNRLRGPRGWHDGSSGGAE